MALFKKTEKKEEAQEAVAVQAHGAHVLKAPRITEKGSAMQSAGAYLFDIAPRAGKREVIAAVKRIYGVTPRKVNVVSIPVKKVRHMRTGKYGKTGGGRKAYVYLKDGDTITIS